MQLPALLHRLQVDGELLALAAERASLDAPVPTCPGWTIRDLVVHVGGVHRWAASIVGNAKQENDEDAGARVGTGPDDGSLFEWFHEGHQALVHSLRAAPSDLVCFTFLPATSSLQFWTRRQAHETAIHRVDAQSVYREITPFDTDFACDGIDEMLFGFATRKRRPHRAGTLFVQPDDAADSWLVTFSADGVAAVIDKSDDADAVVTGSASDVYLWLWNRPSRAAVSGRLEVADQWHDVRVRWG